MQEEVSDDFDDISRVVGRVGRVVAVFVPVWLVLLVVFPVVFGAGGGGSLVAATLLAGMTTWAAGRWFWPRRNVAAADRPSTSPGARLMIGAILAVFLLFAAVFLVAGTR